MALLPRVISLKNGSRINFAPENILHSPHSHFPAKANFVLCKCRQISILLGPLFLAGFDLLILKANYA
jgi:hypothetical protein